MKIVIVAHPQDDHAAPVQWALEQAGHRVLCWPGISCEKQEQASLFFYQPPEVFLGEHALEDGDVIWLRQPGHDPAGPSNETTEALFSAFFDALAYRLETLPVHCINKLSASRRIRNKSVQLHLARTAGLKIPATLMSNSPRAVRIFFDQHPNSTVCKAFASHVWQQQGSNDIAVTETFCLSREQLPPDDEVFTYAPAIYQQMVMKQFDVRVVLMGARIYSFALRTPRSSLDWRLDAALKTVDVEIIDTPPKVEAGLLLFAQKAGVCFGVADFAVDRNGDWWFLEINEQGQFLWLDQFNPQAGLLQKFCAFLTGQGSTQSLEERQEIFVSLAEYEQSHQNQAGPDITTASPTADYKSVEP